MTKTLRELLHEGRGSIKTGPFGTALSASEYSESGVPIISVGEVNYGKFSLRTDTPKAPRQVVDRLPEYVLEEGDIVFARKGAVDRSARVSAAEAGWFLGSDGLRVRPGSAVDSLWLAYFLSLRTSREWLLRHAAGTTMLSLSGSTLGDLPVDYPTRKTQLGIAAVLGALDDKIAANARLVSTANELVDAFFDKTVISHGDGFIDSLGALGEFTKGVSYRRKDLSPGPVALVTLKSITREGTYSPSGLKVFSGQYRPEQRIMPGEIVIAQTDLTQGAEIIGRAVRVPPTDLHTDLVASLDLIVARPRADVPAEFLLGVLRHSRFREHCRSHSSGTTVLHLQRGTIEAYLAPLLPASAQNEYAVKARALIDRIDGANRESEILAELRDTILPALMSGCIRVNEAERQVEDAV